jgi:hypothetical protein
MVVWWFVFLVDYAYPCVCVCEREREIPENKASKWHLGFSFSLKSILFLGKKQ